jgi:phage baseplate assembly protein W
MTIRRDIDLRALSQGSTTASGDVRLLEGTELVKQALLIRLAVAPGELLHRPDFGVGVDLQLELASTPTARAMLANRCQAQVRQDPDVSAARVRVDAGIPSDPARSEAITIQVEAELRSTETLRSSYSFGG